MITYKQLTDKVPSEIQDIVDENKYFLDIDNPHSDNILHLIQSYISYPCNLVYGVYLNDVIKGFVVYDEIRKCGMDVTAHVHSCLSKVLWGKNAIKILKDLRSQLMFTTLHCEIPDIALHTCALAVNLGFKKVGVKTKALPYRNSKGEVSLRDTYIYEWRKEQ